MGKRILVVSRPVSAPAPGGIDTRLIAGRKVFRQTFEYFDKSACVLQTDSEQATDLAVNGADKLLGIAAVLAVN
jgi:hypothetical protein